MKITNVHSLRKIAKKEIYMASDCKNGLHLMIHTPVPDIEINRDFEFVCKEFYLVQAEILYAELKRSLPQGTRDHLFALMAMDKASLFKVL
jgi:hypothetical protein